MVMLILLMGFVVFVLGFNNGLILQWLTGLYHTTPKTLPITFTHAHVNSNATRYWINTSSDSSAVSWRIYVRALSRVGIMFNVSGTHMASCICIGY